jgi:multicomponent Na+:H+ antiporter subunit G
VNALEVLEAALVTTGVAFFIVGSIGILRFPDVYTRLHALTKADNLGLGLLILGLALGSDSLAAMGKLVLIWLLALLASACSSTLIARTARRRGLVPWRKRGDRLGSGRVEAR